MTPNLKDLNLIEDYDNVILYQPNEFLSRMIVKDKSKQLYHGIKVARNIMAISHLFLQMMSFFSVEPIQEKQITLCLF